jgi:hypothetical protein
MPTTIACICGYRGPGVNEGAGDVCPICRTPAAAADAPAAQPSQRMPTPPASPRDAKAEKTPLSKPEDKAGDKPRIRYRIPCPRGHVLKAPARMLGQQVFCPQCNEVFVLNETDSIEYKKEQKALEQEREILRARRWMFSSIVAAVVVFLVLITMIVVRLISG